jgi:hypothetical protein
VGDVKPGSRRRAVGTRDRVISYLMKAGEITDPGGMASTELAGAVGYPGSSVAFAQLLSGMERAGLIEREIRGKRTYRIAAAPAAAADFAARRAAPAAGAAPPASPAPPPGAAGPGAAQAGPAAGAQRGGRSQAPAGPLVPAGGAELDYDELARRLLVQVVQRLASPAGAAQPGTSEHDAGLRQTVASLEQKLASAQSRQRRLTEENARLREQLRQVQESLAQAQERAGASQLETAEVLLLERLLSPLRELRASREEAGTG